MTEVEWSICVTPRTMLQFLDGKVSERKFRLFAVACFTSVRGWGSDDRCRQAVGIAEQYAEGEASDEDLNNSQKVAWRIIDRHLAMAENRDLSFMEAIAFVIALAANDTTNARVNFRNATGVSEEVASALIAIRTNRLWDTNWRLDGLKTHDADELLRHSDLLRCIVGNPFRPVHIEDAWMRWQGGTIPKMAQTVYEERRFDDLPILADALEEAGCCDEQILNHCRGPGPHTRGCFILDALLGKS